MLLIIDDKIPFMRGQAEKLGNTVYLSGSAITADDVRRADALIVRTRTRCDRRLLEGSSVRFVATATIGHDHIDTHYLSHAGIGWSNCPGCNAGSVAQYVESSLLLLQAAGRTDLRNATLGIVGVGHVGSQVALMARRRGIRLLLCDPPRHEGRVRHSHLPVKAEECTASLADVAAEADIITLHTPLTTTGPDATLHLAGEDFLNRLRRKPILINAGRGELTDTEALLRALDRALVSEAVIDTWEGEPHIDRRLLDRAFLATPHIAGYSADGKANGTRMALQAVARHFGVKADFLIEPPQLPAGFAYYPELAGHLPALTGNDSDTIGHLRRYDPRRDSDALKARPEDFERLRGNYPLRRE